MIADASASMKVKAAVAIATAVGLAAVVFALTDSNSGGVPGMPKSVEAIVGSSPLVLTVHEDVLALVSVPDVETLASLEKRFAGEPGVAAEYGPARWLTAQIQQLQASARKHTTANVSAAAQLVRDGASGSLTLNDQTLTSTLVFGTGIAPIHSVHWLLPSASSARIFIKLGSGASAGQVRRELLGMIRAALPDATETLSEG